MTLVGSTLYGMTEQGGLAGFGNIFSINLDGSDFKNLFSFNIADGAYPVGTLILNGSTLYGTTQEGGANNVGTVFALQLVPEPSSAALSAWAQSV